jgi:CRP-like cAMP-binding protein
VSSPQSPRQNHLLAALPAEVYARLLPHLQVTPMPLGWPVYEIGDQMEKMYFPTSCIVSLLHTMKDGTPAEIALVGSDGVVGTAVLMGGSITPTRGVVQSAGHAYVIESEVLRDEFQLGGPLQQLLLRYTQALITQMTQTAVCNRHHSVEQQLSRWLLLSLDRLSSNKLLMTQRLIANMLGSRQGAMEALEKMQKAGLIEYDRGCIIVPDRQKLEAHVCECYAVVKAEFDRLLPRNGNLFGGASPRALTPRRSQFGRNGRRMADAREQFGAASPGETQRRTQPDRRARRSGDTREELGAAPPRALTQRRTQSDRSGRRIDDAREEAGTALPGTLTQRRVQPERRGHHPEL